MVFFRHGFVGGATCTRQKPIVKQGRSDSRASAAAAAGADTGVVEVANHDSGDSSL